MKVKESLVYDKVGAKIIGFADLGDVNNQLIELEESYRNDSPQTSLPGPVATHMLVMMVRGIFMHLSYPYAHFPTSDLTGASLFMLVWEGIERLETLGFKVLAVTGDGVSVNRKCFKLHSSAKTCYKTKNPYTEDDRDLFFISDVPHLLKTTRNCWSHTGAHGSTRHLWINDHEITWKHLTDLYDAKVTRQIGSSGLALLQKLTFEHVKLTSYSRMRVDLAVQVLSESVANALQYYAQPGTEETERFVRVFDKFFDCLNVRAIDEGLTKRKPNLAPYRAVDDERLKWLEGSFIRYLDQWEDSVKKRKGFTDGEKAMMMLSRETVEGLKITVKSFVEIARFLLALPDAKDQFLLSERLSQDPLENYFGCQRGRGGRNENPSVGSTLDSAQSIRVQRSLALKPVRGNCGRKRQPQKEVVDDTPLSKRPRQSKK